MDTYINKHRINYIRRTRIEYLSSKYSNKFEFNNITLSVIRIQRYLRKHFFINVINEYKDILPLHRYRLKMTFDNLFENKNDNDEFKEVILMTMENKPPKDVFFYIIIDISNPIRQYNYNDNTYYVSPEDRYKINMLYKKVNNIIYEQNYNYHKSMSKDLFKKII